MKALRLSTDYSCPLRCRACYAPTSNKTSMTPEQIRKVIEAAAKERFAVLALGGGEPIYNLANTLIALEAAREGGMLSAITTSGHGLTSQVLGRLEGAGLNHLQLSLGANRINITSAYEFVRSAERKCTFGVNLLMSPKMVSSLRRLTERFEADGACQVTLLCPRGRNAPDKFTLADFMRYYMVLRTLKRDRMVVKVDCVSREVLKGNCPSWGVSFFPDMTVSRCGFGCGPRTPWTGSFDSALAEDSGHCAEGKAIMTETGGVNNGKMAA